MSCACPNGCWDGKVRHAVAGRALWHLTRCLICRGRGAVDIGAGETVEDALARLESEVNDVGSRKVQSVGVWQ